MKKKLLLYNSFMLLILLILIEVIFRLLEFGYENAPLENDAYLHHKNPSNYSFKCYTPDGEYGGHHIFLDNLGRRENRKQQKKVVGNEVWFFGDSFTAAYQVDWKNSYVGLLDSLTDYNAKNFGVSSYSPLLYYLQLKLHLQNNQKPEKVFIQLYSNDIGGDKIYAEHTQFEQNEPLACVGEDPNYVIRYLRKLYIVRVVRKTQLTLQYLVSHKKDELRINKHVEKVSPIDQGTQISKSILGIKALLESHDIEYYFFAIPSKYACISGDWESANFATNMNTYFQENDIPFVNMNTVFRNHTQPAALFYKEDIHCNEIGNFIIAKELINKLQ